MAGYICHAVPPYILQGLVDAPDIEPHVREMAISTLTITQQCHHERHNCSKEGASRTYPQDSDNQYAPQGIVPDYILQDVAAAEEIDDDARSSAQETLAASSQARHSRAAASAVGETGTQLSAVAGTVPVKPPAFDQEIFDMQHKDVWEQLPGSVLLRKEGSASIKDTTANEAHDNTLVVLNFFWDVFGYASVNGRNAKVRSSVHFGDKYANAVWYVDQNLGIEQMVYGDGDGETLGSFSKALDVVGHEFTHGITDFNSKLEYEGESGALNEHLSDVFGILVKQKFENKKADAADWLIGEACFMLAKKGVALRHMLHPGKAFARDPQPDHYTKIQETKDKFPELKGTGQPADWGGVHYFSGIPNRAFALCALRFGGFAWEKAGRIWWNASIVKKASIPQKCTFIQFADVTVESAMELYGADAATIVRDVWNQVGVERKH